MNISVFIIGTRVKAIVDHIALIRRHIASFEYHLPSWKLVDYYIPMSCSYSLVFL